MHFLALGLGAVLLWLVATKPRGPRTRPVPTPTKPAGPPKLPPKPTVPQSTCPDSTVQNILRDHAAGRATVQQLSDAMELAALTECYETAAYLSSEIVRMGGLPEPEKPIVAGRRPPDRPSQLRVKSPIKGVPDSRWVQFAGAFSTGDSDSVTRGNHLGMFRIGYRRLADLGLVENLRKDKVNGKTVWGGDFIAPLTREAFLGDVGVQYDVFEKDILTAMPAVQAKFADFIGSDLDGEMVTLSGLLALVKQGGLKGASRWLASAEDRERHPNTSQAFARANGLF